MPPSKIARTVAALAVLAAACGGAQDPSASDSSTPSTTSSTTTTEAETTTTTEAFTRVLDVTLEPPAADELTLVTEDGVEVYARWWPGNDVGVLVGHDFSNPTPGSTGQRAPQASENQLWLLGALAREGYSVLAPDFRGHGNSGGEFDVRSGPVDLAAGYAFLREQGVGEIIMIGWVGSGTAAAVLDAERDDVAFDGILFAFSPPQDTGLDAQVVLPELSVPTAFIGSNGGPSARFARLMARTAQDPLWVHVFERTPTGLNFVDVFGGELAGRIADFVDTVAAR